LRAARASSENTIQKIITYASWPIIAMFILSSYFGQRIAIRKLEKCLMEV
jgi:hypothetical protein